MTGYSTSFRCSVLLVLASAMFVARSCFAEPLVISVAVPEGNYRVTVKLGDARAATSTTVKSENRRLMLEERRRRRPANS